MSNYSSTAEVVALTRMYLVGESTYNTTTRPTATELNTFISRGCGVLDLALSNAGFEVPITDPTAKLACDEWVTQHAAMFVELSQPTMEFGEMGNGRGDALYALGKDAISFVEANMLGFQNLGVTQNNPVGQGVQYTGQLVHSQRADPTNTTLEQPFFRRRQFDAPGN